MTRSIAGLILVLSPLAGLLYIDLPYNLSLIFVCSMAAGTLLCPYCRSYSSFRLITIAAAGFSCAGSFFCASGAENTAAARLGACLAGLAAAWLALCLAPCITRAGKTLLLPAVWTVSLIFGSVYGNLMERNTYFALFIYAASSFAGAIFFLRSRVFFFFENISSCCEPATADRRSASIKIMFFSAASGFAAGLSFFTLPSNIPFDFFLAPEAMFFAGLITGPVTAGLISDRKSVYNSCIFILFIAEIAAAGAFHGDRMIFLTYTGNLACGMLISGMLVILPLLTAYLSDIFSFRRRLSFSFFAVSAGAAAAFFIIPYYKSSPLISPAVFIFLASSFLTLFSAWKHRLFLLKSPGM